MAYPKMNEIRPGMWSFRVSLGTDPVTGRRIQQRVTTLGTHADAVRRYQEIEADKLARSHPSSAITNSSGSPLCMKLVVTFGGWTMCYEPTATRGTYTLTTKATKLSTTIG